MAEERNGNRVFFIFCFFKTSFTVTLLGIVGDVKCVRVRVCKQVNAGDIVGYSGGIYFKKKCIAFLATLIKIKI